MDARRVNSRAIHDDAEPQPEFNNSGSSDDRDFVDVGEKGTAATDEKQQPHQQVNDDLERQQTMRSTASYQETYPEGGLQAWVVVAGSWFAMIASMGLMNSIAVFQAYTLSHQLKGHSEGTVGWIFSIYTWLAFFGGVYIGPVFDKYGPRWLVIAGLGHWFKARRGFATGLASTAGGIGGIVFPLMLTALFERIGFGWATRVLALICLVCGLIGICLVRSRLPPAKNATAHPDFRIFRQIPFLLTTLGVFLLEFSLFIPLTYIATYAQDRGFDDAFAYHLLPIMNAGSVIGRALPGYYADVVGAFNVCLFSVVLSLVSCLCVWLPLGHTKAGIIIFSLLFGFGSGNSIAIAPVCIGRMCKTQEYGRYYATTYTVVSFACLIGIPIAGSIVQADGGSYTGLIIFTSCIYVGSAILLMLAKTWQLGWKNWLAAY
ncbi:hypothetical protein TrVFT333_001964 [Trichoderma virens FT-333]|nr:hypothetical protein TrVFT333_001964 [Trichoderma virens FT-333]